MTRNTFVLQSLFSPLSVYCQRYNPVVLKNYDICLSVWQWVRISVLYHNCMVEDDLICVC